MATTKTFIANLALSHIKDKADLENVDTQTTPQAIYCRLWYDITRQQALVDMDPGFARKRRILGTHSEAVSADWTFRYQYPDDCLQPRFFQNPGGRQANPIPFDIEQADDNTRSILTDLDDGVLVYTRDATDAGFFTPHFILGHSFLLAHHIAGPLAKGSRQTRADLLSQYNAAINTGGAHEANVTSVGTDVPPEAGSIRAR